jgi:hypothetical protein
VFYTQNLFFNHFNLKTPKNNSKISVKPFMPLNNSKHGPEKKKNQGGIQELLI